MDDLLPPDLEAEIAAHKAAGPETAPAFSEEALALQFAEVHEDDLRYVAAWGKWFVWDGVRWARDDTLKALDYARQICREASAECNSPNVARVLGRAQTVAAVERLAKADRRLAATTSQWDADPWLLNTPEGTVNLKTGDLHPHRAKDYCTKMTAEAPGGECSLWLSTLNYIFGGNNELVSFFQRWAGYSLTGVTTEQKLVFEHGTGGNGKGVTTGTMVGVIGDYAMAAPMETFTASSSERHPTDLAMLRGARLVTASETEDGRAWAESRIKQMTGGDKISARFMRQDFFEFMPQFKLLIAGNHRPSFRGVDEAIRRRFLLLPFLVTVPAADRDPDLSEKLKAEWPGILAWMIQGCLEWQERGLRPPEVVLEATKNYLDAEDALGLWLSDAATDDPNAWEATKDLFSSWTSWAKAAGELVGNEKRFVEALEGAGYVKAKNSAGTKRGFKGLKLNRPDLASDPRYVA
jgi:putative DNA primase/helicase